jgi:hypothetical protein
MFFELRSNPFFFIDFRSEVFPVRHFVSCWVYEGVSFAIQFDVLIFHAYEIKEILRILVNHSLNIGKFFQS